MLCESAGKHHRAYVDNMNKAIVGTDAENQTLEQVVVASWNGGSPTPVFNNAAQVRVKQLSWTMVGGSGVGRGQHTPAGAGEREAAEG